MLNPKISTFHVLIILLLYFVCFGSYALVNVPFWDDWVLSQYGVDGLWELFKQVGRREQYFMTAPFVATSNPMSWAAASFISWGIVALSVYVVLQGIGWTRGNSFWAAALTAAAPLNQARFGLAMTPYAISAALYSLSLVMLVISIRRQRPWLRLPSALFLTLSFSTNSFLVMVPVAVGVAFLAQRDIDPDRRFWPALRGALLRVELLILPMAYWVSKALYQPTYGLYADYNKFKVGALAGIADSFRSLINQGPDFLVFFPSSSHLVEGGLIAVMCLTPIVAAIILRRGDLALEKGSPKENWLVFAALFCAAALALFPYAMVGIQPAYGGLWETRHQTTLAVLAGALGLAGLRAILPARLLPAICTVVLGCFIALDISASRQLLADVYESNAIIHSPAIAAIPDGTMVGIFESDRPYRMMVRQFRFYELSSMLNAHSAKKTLVALSNHEVVDPKTKTYVLPGSRAFPEEISEICQKWVNLPQYGFGDFVYNGQFAEVTFLPKAPPPDLLEGLQAAFGFLFDRQGTIDEAVTGLDVRVEMRPFPEGRCAAAVSS